MCNVKGVSDKAEDSYQTLLFPAALQSTVAF